MAFWGVVLKPKKSHKVKFSDFQAPRLHLSQATLVSRKSEDRTIVKCRSGVSPVVYVCSFLPGSVETCSLDLFFDDDVTFTVKGPSSVHLAGYFEGIFDGNESGEDVEEDGYSDEEEDDSDLDSLDGFIVGEDEELHYDGDDVEEDEEDWSSEEDEIMVRNTGVTIEELHDDTETPEKSIVPVRGLLKDSKHFKENGSADVSKMVDKKGAQHKEDGSVNAQVQSYQASSSEDEDGFHVSRKRKKCEAASEQPLEKEVKGVTAEQPPKEESAELPEMTTQQDTVAEKEHETDADAKGSSKKRKKKKKKSKDSSEDASISPSASAETPGTTLASSKPNKKAEEGKDDSKIVPTSKEGDDNRKGTSKERDDNRKGTVRKYPNGLEVENIKMGRPDGKQASPGKKVGMIYTGRLRSNDKIFDSNVGQKPFFFRLGVGEVIKGWDIGVNGMRIGDKRRLTVPPAMGYGSKGVSGIPPNSWLKFDVELVEVK